MNPELLGMSNEELIQWAVQRGCIEEKELIRVMPDIEAFCAKTPIGIPDFIETLVRMVNNGIRFRRAVNAIKERCA